jgi:cell division transport system permease protein
MIRALAYFLSEASVSLWRGRRASLLSIVTIAAAVFVLGAFLIVTSNLDRAALSWRAAAEISVYLRDQISADEKAAIDRALAESPLVAGRDDVSKDQASQRFRELFPELAAAAATLPDNPFPASVEVRLRPGATKGDAVEALVRQLERQDGVADVQYDRRWLDRLAAFSAAVRWAGVVLALLLGGASALTVTNVVRLALYARRDEIEIMQLVGAPLGRIRGPFVAEGILHGGAGSVLALLALSVAYAVVRLRFGAVIARMAGGLTLQFLPASLCAVLFLGGMAVGCLGGLVASRGVR